MKMLRQTIIIIVSLMMALKLGAQNTEGVSIRSTPQQPHQSAMLDVYSTNKGLLVPRVPLTSTSSAGPITVTPAEGLLVYNTNTVGTAPPVGFYYWTVNHWQRLNTNVQPDLWQLEPATTSTNNIFYYRATDYTSVTVGTPTTNFSKTRFYCYGPIRVAAGTSTSVSSGTVDPNDGIFIGDTTHHPGVNSSGNYGGHGNEINCRNHPLSLQYNTGQDVTMGDYAGTNVYIHEGPSSSTVSPKGNLYVDGTITAVCHGSYSDSTLKKDIVLADTIMYKVRDCNTYTYRFKKENSEQLKHYGVIAQEIQSIFPELVRSQTDTTWTGDKFATPRTYTTRTVLTVDYGALSAVLLRAIKEQQVAIDDLKARVYRLEKP